MKERRKICDRFIVFVSNVECCCCCYVRCQIKFVMFLVLVYRLSTRTAPVEKGGEYYEMRNEKGVSFLVSQSQ
jgi:hypothetical protein